MAAVRTLMILLGALAVLTLGATPMAAMANSPCHSQQHQQSPAEAPSKALKVMNCCVACVAAPRVEPPATPGAPATAVSIFAAPHTVLSGLTPCPAHGPPRT